MERLLVGFGDELVKTSARAGLKLIRRLVQGGNLAKAERVALTPGVLKKTRAGSEIKDLGRGMEGVSTLIAHPKKGIAVRKLYDPQGVSTPMGILRKEEFAKEVRSPGLPAFHGSAKAKGGHTMHFSEYVPGKTQAAMHDSAVEGMADKTMNLKDRVPRYAREMEGYRQVEAQRKRVMRTAGRERWQVADLHKGNVIGTPSPSGRLTHGKAVDLLPYRRTDNTRDLVHSDRLPSVRGVVDPYFTNRAVAGDIKRQAFRGTAPKYKLPPAPPKRIAGGTPEMATAPGGSSDD